MERCKTIFTVLLSRPKKALHRYKEIFVEIQEMKDKKTNPKEYINIKRKTETYDNEFNEWYTITINPYSSLSFVSWIELANLKVRQNNLLNAQIMAHFLWEITYHGFYEKKIQKKRR